MSDKRPLLSIIIPVFNNELYIKQTLTSVFEQIDNDVEVIIVNDGSTDNSAALIQKADVRVESEPGEGSTFTVTFPEK